MNYFVMIVMICSSMSYGMQFGALIKYSSSRTPVLSSHVNAAQNVRSNHSSCTANSVLATHRFLEKPTEKTQSTLLDLLWKHDFYALGACLDKQKCISPQDKADLEEALELEHACALEELVVHKQKSQELYANLFGTVASVGTCAASLITITSSLEWGPVRYLATTALGACVIAVASERSLSYADNVHTLLRDEKFIPLKKKLVQRRIAELDLLEEKVHNKTAL